MNLVDFFEQQVSKWNDEEKCGLCWAFDAPLTESAVELHQPTEENKCCVQVLLTQDKVVPFSTTNTYDQQTSLLTRVLCSQSFQLLVLLPEDIGRNNHGEIPGHDREEGKYTRTLWKLQQCLMCDMNFDFCEFLGTTYQVTQWSAKQEINFTGINYSGYRITATFQRVNPV